MKKKLIIPAIAIVLLTIDQLIKLLATNHLVLNHSIKIINNFFNITLAHNYGGAWSIFSGNRIFLITIGFIVLVGLIWIIAKEKDMNILDTITYGILLGGLLGNLFDRTTHGYVIDYLDFKIFNYDFPIFNFADICLVSSVVILILIQFRGEKNEIQSN